MGTVRCLRVHALIALVVLLSGCANLASVHHTFRPDDGTSISIDAKQRVVYSINKTFKDPVTGRLKYEWRAICAEPSPDALSAISTSSGVSAETLKVALSAAFGLQEGAASIGLRTQTIQILRDAMYRLCEGYASGALDNIGFSRLQRRYQNIMLGLLAIEQLTGAVVAKQALLSGSADSSVSRSLLEINKALDHAKAAKRDTESALKDVTTKKATADTALATAKKGYEDEKKKANDDVNADAVKKFKAETLDPAQKASDDAAKRVADAKKIDGDAGDTVASLTDALASAAKVSASQTTKGLLDGGGYSSTINAQTVQHIANAVENIVKDIAGRNYTQETCLDFMLSRDSRVLEQGQAQYEMAKVALHYCSAALVADAVRLRDAAAKATGAEKQSFDRLINALDAQSKAMSAAIDKMPAYSALESERIEGKPITK